VIDINFGYLVFAIIEFNSKYFLQARKGKAYSLHPQGKSLTKHFVDAVLEEDAGDKETTELYREYRSLEAVVKAKKPSACGANPFMFFLANSCQMCFERGMRGMNTMNLVSTLILSPMFARIGPLLQKRVLKGT
jgi:hypothetical protein